MTITIVPEITPIYPQYIHRLQPQFVIELTTGEPCSLEELRWILRRYLAHVHRAFIGSNWHEKSPNERIDGIFFLESFEASKGARGVVNIPYADREAVQDWSNRVWDHLCPVGTVLVSPIDFLQDAADFAMRQAGRYNTGDDYIVFAGEFMKDWPVRQVRNSGILEGK